MIFEVTTQITRMKNTKHSAMSLSALYKILLFLVLLPIGSCATIATSRTKEEVNTRKTQRQEAIKKEIRIDLRVGDRYIDYGFAPEIINKPGSFRKLDSLYAAFYAEEQKSGSSRNKLSRLRSEIEQEQAKVSHDTIHFIYEIPHFYGLSRGDSIEITFGTFYLNAQNKVIDLKVDYYFTVPTSLNSFFGAYARRESFVEFGFLPSRGESDFYNLYDEVANSLTNPRLKGNFIAHTLHLMRAACHQKGFGTEPLVKQHIINIITQNVKDYKPLKWSKVYVDFDENDVILSYNVDHEWTYKDPFGVVHTMMRHFELNPYFEIQEVTEIALIRD